MKQTCEVCGQPLDYAAAVMWQRVDPRFKSGLVQKITFVHRACKPKDEGEA